MKTGKRVHGHHGHQGTPVQLLRHPDHTPSIIPAQALTLGAFLAAAVGSAAGILFG